MRKNLIDNIRRTIPVEDNVNKQDFVVSQNRTVEAVDDVTNNPWQRASLIPKRVELLALDVNYVEHGLNRKWQGWQIVDIDKAAMVYCAGESVDDKRYLPLITTADVSIKLLVW